MSINVHFTFNDAVNNGQECKLVFTVNDGTGMIAGISHPSCDRLADISLDLDAFYCTACKYNGKVSGAWINDMRILAGIG